MKFFLIVAAILAAVTTADARPRRQRAVVVPQETTFGWGGDIISEARRHLGARAVFGRASLWCGRFVSVVLKSSGKPAGSDLARSYSGYGRPANGPAPGVIAVYRHHVGIVTAVPRHGRIVMISGNDSRAVRERERSTAGIIAYRWP
jgi:uncharacterized protein (TIGR02594 family)